MKSQQLSATPEMVRRNQLLEAIGDSLSSDVKGASSLGINTIWMNRNNKEVPDGVVAVASCADILNTPFF